MPSTPRQIVLYRALIDIGITDFVPQFGHLPFVMGEGNKKLSKRAPEGSLQPLSRGRLPARGTAELPGAAGLVDRRRPRRVHDGRDGRGVRHRRRQRQLGALRPEEVRGDQRHAHPDAAGRRVRAAPGRATCPTPIRRSSRLPRRWCRSASRPCVEGADMLRFLVDDDDSRWTRPPPPSSSARPARPCWRLPCRRWSRCRRGMPGRSSRRCARPLVDGLGLKPRNAYGPIRVAVTGRTVSPPLFESLELLGRERSLRRLRAAAT